MVNEDDRLKIILTDLVISGMRFRSPDDDDFDNKLEEQYLYSLEDSIACFCTRNHHSESSKRVFRSGFKPECFLIPCKNHLNYYLTSGLHEEFKLDGEK
jgi:hypothetical protein